MERIDLLYAEEAALIEKFKQKREMLRVFGVRRVLRRANLPKALIIHLVSVYIPKEEQ